MPQILMLDELSEGLAPVVVSQAFQAIVAMSREMGLGSLLAEQNAAVADIADTLIFMSAVDRSNAVDIAGLVFGG